MIDDENRKHFLNSRERIAVKQVCKAADHWGYGNMIDRLHMAWAGMLLKKYPEMGISTALRSALISDTERIKRCEKVGKDKLLKWIEQYTGEENE